MGAAVSASAASSKSPIVIGTINDVTGPEASVYGDTNKAMQAWADWTNANGGINGHKVKLIALDDQFNPTTAVTEAKELVEQDHVVALVGEQSSYDSEFAAYLQKAGVPIVGDGLFNQVAYSYTDAFPEGTDNLATQYNLVQLGTLKGFKKFANLYCAEAPACAQGVPLLKQDAAHLGVAFSYVASISASAPSYTAQCLGAKASGAQYMFIADATPITLRVAQECEQQGYAPLQVDNGLSVTAALGTPVLNGLLAVEPVRPYFDTSYPAVKTMVDALDKYAPGVVGSADYGMSESYGWTSGILFTQGAEAAHASGNLTSADLIKGLESLRGTTLDGLSPPLTFAKNADHHVACEFVIGYKNGKFDLPQGNKLICAPSAFS
jgi:branched-chain amino acid transport system substrate-binding protein